MLLTIMKEEMVYLIILLLFLTYTKTYEKIGEEKRFRKIAFCALLYVGLNLTFIVLNQFHSPSLTVILMICNCGLGVFLMLFSVVMFEYTLFAIYSKESIKNRNKILYGLLALSAVLYIGGYQYFFQKGIACIFSIVFLVGSVTVLIRNKEKLEKIVFYPLVVTNILFICTLIVQIIFPKLLLTSASITVFTVVISFWVENPAEKIKIRTYMDWDTGVKNKYCFGEDLERMERKWKAGNVTSIGIVVCDLNGLKSINDRYGHVKGDLYIRQSAKILQEAMICSYGLYRIGGDEFAALYIDEKEVLIKEELSRITNICERVNHQEGLSISIATGFSMARDRESLKYVVEWADGKMYQKKKQMKEYTGRDGMKV